MGITYKLKQEVVGYILDQKQANPKLSCRQIAETASVHFQKKISKSSVNSILKQKSLSSPVGRRAKKNKPPKIFKLPDFRKDQIFKNISDVEPKQKKDHPPQATETIRPEKKHDSSREVKKIGSVILRIAEEQIAAEPLIFQILKKYSDLNLDDDIRALSRLILYAAVLKISIKELLEKDNITLREICGVLEHSSCREIPTILQSIEKISSKKNEIFLDCKQWFEQACFFDFILENGIKYSCDVQGESIWTNKNVQSNQFRTLSFCFDFLSKYFTFNKAPLIVKKIDKHCFSSFLMALLYCFENIPGYRIRKISLFNANSEEIFSVENPIQKKRHAIIGIEPDQPEIEAVNSVEQQPDQEFFWPLRQRTIYLKEKRAVVSAVLSEKTIEARTIFFWEKTQQPRTQALFTNISSQMLDAKEVFKMYLERWPHSMEPEEIKSFQDQDVLPSAIAFEKEQKTKDSFLNVGSFSDDLVGFLADQLIEYINDHYFKKSFKAIALKQISSLLQELTGCIDKQQQFYFVKVSAISKILDKEDLFSFLRRLNESACFHSQKEKIFFITPCKQKE